MDNAFQSRIDLFLKNAEIARQGFVWKDTHVKHLVALLFTAEGRTIDVETLKACERMIKEKTGIFSTFRGNSALTIAAMMALKNEPQVLIGKSIDVYERMKRAGFRASDYLVIASFLIAEYAGTDAWASMQTEPPSGAIYWRDASVLDPFGPVVAKAKAFFEGMRQGHWFITGQDDYILAAMLGLSGLPIESGVARIQRYYDELKPDFHSGNAVQALAQVLALGGDMEGLPSRVRDLAEGFRAYGLRLDRQYTLSTLGVLGLLPQDRDTIVRSIQESYEYLRQQRRFGPWSIGKQEVLLYASALFAFASVENIEKGLLRSTIATSITSIVIAQQAAMIAAVSASSAASSAAASNGGG